MNRKSHVNFWKVFGVVSGCIIVAYSLPFTWPFFVFGTLIFFYLRWLIDDVEHPLPFMAAIVSGCFSVPFWVLSFGDIAKRIFFSLPPFCFL